MALGRSSVPARGLTAALASFAVLAVAQGCATNNRGFDPVDAAPRDASAVDAARDAASPDARPGTCSPPTTLADLATTTSFGLAAPFGQNVCTTSGVRAFYSACLGSNASSSGCTAWRNANASCSSCLLTPRGSTRVGPFHTDSSQPPSNENPASLVADWSRAIVATCVNGFAAGCGEPALDLDSCLGRACAPAGNCAGEPPTVVAACRERAGEASFACRAPLLTREAACPGVFGPRDGGARGGETCFPTANEDLATPSGAEGYLTRLALVFCGP